MVSNDAVLYLIKLTSRFISTRKAPSIRPAMKTGINVTACQSEFLRQFLLGASGFYLYPKEAQNFVLTAMAADWSSRFDVVGLCSGWNDFGAYSGGKRSAIQHTEVLHPAK
jgi:hypothetical protein